MKKLVTRPVRWVVRRLGYDVVRAVPEAGSPTYPLDCDADTVEIIERVGPYTLTSPERIMALRAAVEHVCRARVPGALVECGVWRGGSAMVMALTLLRLGVTDRDLFLYDTYTHMPEPEADDVDLFGTSAADFYDEAVAAEAFRYLSIEEVRAAIASTGYPMARVHLVAGMVEDTIPAQAPEAIALLRLDTDWYRSTAHEMHHLWPRLSRGGILIVDDYGHFMGAKKAVDEHFAGLDDPPMLHRIDFTGRLVVKP